MPAAPANVPTRPASLAEIRRRTARSARPAGTASRSTISGAARSNAAIASASALFLTAATTTRHGEVSARRNRPANPPPSSSSRPISSMKHTSAPASSSPRTRAIASARVAARNSKPRPCFRRVAHGIRRAPCTNERSYDAPGSAGERSAGAAGDTKPHVRHHRPVVRPSAVRKRVLPLPTRPVTSTISLSAAMGGASFRERAVACRGGRS